MSDSADRPIATWTVFRGDVQQRVVARLDQVADDPFGSHTKPLAGPGARRAARVGALRIVFTVDRDQHLVDISDIGPRGQIYRGL